MFPRTTKDISTSNFKFGIKFLQKDLQLNVDKDKCQGCGICSTVCPHEALVNGPIKTSEDAKLHKVMNGNIILDVSDPTKCVYCGTCTYFCPFDAIHLYIDGEKVPKEQLLIVTGRAVPKLGGEKKILEKTNKEAHIYLEGTVEIQKLKIENDKEFQEYNTICPGECRKCVDICPTGALEVNSIDDAKKTGIAIKIDDEKCIACGSCVQACPYDRITLKRTKILIEGSFNKGFMTKICEKLQVPLFSED
ncbi:MAG: 4Fe-4S binding protein [Promethearchaeota archaeon]